MKRATKTTLFKLLSSTFFWLGFLSIIISLFFFFTGLHNADLAHNLSLINARYDLDLVDQTSNFEVMNARTLYIIGLRQMILGFFTALFGMLFFIIGFVGLYGSKK